MGPKIKKALVIASGIIVFIVVVVVIAFQVFFRLPLPSYSGTLKLEGLKGGVEVRTARTVPIVSPIGFSISNRIMTMPR